MKENVLAIIVIAALLTVAVLFLRYADQMAIDRCIERGGQVMMVGGKAGCIYPTTPKKR